MLIDTHCHLQDDAFASDQTTVIQTALAEGVTKFICIGTSLKDSAKAVELSQKYAEVYATVGIYPHEKITGDFREKLVELAKNKNVVGIGECGLDYPKDDSTQAQEQKVEFKTNSKEIQKSILRKQLGTAIQLDLPVIIHNRNADEDILEELAHYKETQKLRGVFHCFTGTKEFAQKVLNLNFYISFTGIVTYPTAKHLEDVIKMMPKDKILLETDSPYLAPAPNRGKRNEPKNVRIIARHVAEILHITPDEVEKITSQNAVKLFGI